MATRKYDANTIRGLLTEARKRRAKAARCFQESDSLYDMDEMNTFQAVIEWLEQKLENECLL